MKPGLALRLSAIPLAILAHSACGSTEEAASSSTSIGDCLDKSFGAGVPAWISDNFDCVQVTLSGGNYVFKTNDIPPHDSYYFGSSDSRYASLPSGRTGNPNQIITQSITLTLDATPTTTGGSTATAGDVIGVATDGVAFFNNQAAPGDLLSNEVQSFDAYNGHPQNTGKYHYHGDPIGLSDDTSALVGVLLDGFPVFGRRCPANGNYPGNGTAALDANNGHTAATGITGLGTIYHYHIADISGDTAGTFRVVTGSYGGTPGTAVSE